MSDAARTTDKRRWNGRTKKRTHRRYEGRRRAARRGESGVPIFKMSDAAHTTDKRRRNGRTKKRTDRPDEERRRAERGKSGTDRQLATATRRRRSDRRRARRPRSGYRPSGPSCGTGGSAFEPYYRRIAAGTGRGRGPTEKRKRTYVLILTILDSLVSRAFAYAVVEFATPTTS